MKRRFFTIMLHVYTTGIIYLLVLIAGLTVESCGSKNDSPKQPTEDSANNGQALSISEDSLVMVKNAVIEIAAGDFYKNQVPLPEGFRNVQLRYIIKPSGELLYILCGQFMTHESGDKEVWTPFATIKNSAYEQWIGKNGLPFCEDSKGINYSKTDLSLDLTQRLKSLEEM